MGMSNVETILEQALAGETITVTPESRVEALLIALINSGGGGGGGTTNYNQLQNKPQIAGTTLQGNKTLNDLGIASKEDMLKRLMPVVDLPETVTDGLIILWCDEDTQTMVNGGIYIYDGDNQEWLTLYEPSGGGGDASLETAVTSNTAVGAIPSGTTLPRGTTFTEFAQKLLISEVAPTVSFSISKSGNVAKGGSYTETLTVNVSAMGSAKKIKTIAWYQGSTLLQTDTIDSTVAGSWTYTMGTATTDTTTFKAVVTYTKSDDTDTSVTKTASITFLYNKFYGGVSDLDPTEATVEALTSALASGKGGTYSFTVTAGRICYAYPKSLGALTSIKDGNGFSLFDSFTRTEQSYTQAGETVAYYRYVLTDSTTVSGYSVTFA